MTLRHSVAEKDHFAFVAQLPCCVSGRLGVEVAHIRFADYLFNKPITGVAMKPDFIWTVPLTPEAHRKQHAMGERQFWNQAGYPHNDVARGPLALALMIAGFATIGDAEGAARLINQRVVEGMAR